MFAPLLRELERIPHYTIDTPSGEDRFLRRKFVLGAAENPSADRRVLALGILADHDEVDLFRRAVGEWCGDALEQTDRAEIDVLIEAAADWNQQSPQRDVIGHAGVADSAEKHRVELLQLLEPVLRHHAAGLRVDLAAPVEMRHLI